MTKISAFYDEKDLTRKAEVVQFNDRLWVEFFVSDVIIDSIEIEDKRISHAENIAENYIISNYVLSTSAWRLNGV